MQDVSFTRQSTQGCLLREDKMFLTDPEMNRFQTICFNNGKPYKFSGVFGNKSLNMREQQHFDFKVSINFEYIGRYGTILAAFGITQDHILPEFIICEECRQRRAFGWYLRLAYDTLHLVNSDGVIVDKDVITTSYSRSFRCFIKQDGTLLLTYKSTNVPIDQTRVKTDMKNFKSMFYIYQHSFISTKIKSLTNSLIFNVSTSSPNLYFSDDFKTVYDSKPYGSFVNTNKRYFGITTSIHCNHLCVLPIQFLMDLDTSLKPFRNEIHLLTARPRSPEEAMQSFDTSKSSIYFTRCEGNDKSYANDLICVSNGEMASSSNISSGRWNTLLIFFSRDSVYARLNNTVEFKLMSSPSLPIQVAFLAEDPSSMYVEIEGEHTLLDEFIYFPVFFRNLLFNSYLGIFIFAVLFTLIFLFDYHS